MSRGPLVLNALFPSSGTATRTKTNAESDITKGAIALM
jgi:hypothetical protein